VSVCVCVCGVCVVCVRVFVECVHVESCTDRQKNRQTDRWILHLPTLGNPLCIITHLVILFQFVQEALFPQLNWPVDEVQVEVLQLQVLQRGLTSWEDIITTVIRAPMSDKYSIQRLHFTFRLAPLSICRVAIWQVKRHWRSLEKATQSVAYSERDHSFLSLPTGPNPVNVIKMTTKYAIQNVVYLSNSPSLLHFMLLHSA